MYLVIIQFLLSALAIVIAGVYLVKSSDAIGEVTKLGRFFAGSIFLAAATSLPELLVDISAVKKSMPDLAVGDLMGSSLMNLLILAIADIIHQSPNKVFLRSGAHHALSAAMSINMTVLACIAMFLGPQLTNFTFGELGFGPIVIGVFYILGLRLILNDQKTVESKIQTISIKNINTKLLGPLSIYFLSALVILVAAPFLTESAGAISEFSGLSKTFVGSSLVAVCTSLPEIVSTTIAVRMGAFDLAAGNIFGSNSFNMILLIPLDLIQEGNILGVVSRSHILTGLSVILATSVAVIGQLYQVEKRKKFIEPDAFAVIGIIVVSMVVLYWLN